MHLINTNLIPITTRLVLMFQRMYYLSIDL